MGNMFKVVHECSVLKNFVLENITVTYLGRMGSLNKLHEKCMEDINYVHIGE